MKALARDARESGNDTAPASQRAAEPIVLGSIPGLARLLPGRYAPGQPIRSRYGTWILPVAFKGRRVRAVVDGTMLG